MLEITVRKELQMHKKHEKFKINVNEIKFQDTGVNRPADGEKIDG